MTTNKPATYWAPRAALERLENRCNNAPCVLTDTPGPVNDVALIRLSDHEADKARIAELELLLSDAAQEIEDWGAYAPEYFQEKHDLAGVVARFRAALSKPKEPGA